ncbi:thiamine phosphate synthase [Robbsia andropogonis]|uniref:thiamine phosphate synthase n=1 Tax=Robbsia andropogonis TaxID=28092 RepID=UPI002A6A8316|nr:thiamine phosphate synthase [Robbsia andropogonis]
MTRALPEMPVRPLQVREPSGRITRFFRDAWPVEPRQATALAESGEATGVRDVLVVVAAGVSARSLYLGRQNGRQAGACAVIDASAPGRTRLLRDGWDFFYAATRDADDAWLGVCAAFVEDGFALHDALCLALAHVAGMASSGRRVPRGTNGEPRVEGWATGVDDDLGDVRRDVVMRPVPPLAAFPDVMAPCRITDGVAAGVPDSPFDETVAGTGGFPMAPASEARMPATPTPTPTPSSVLTAFPRCTDVLGIYPIAPSAEWVRRLVEAGARTIQLRIKTPYTHADVAPHAASDLAPPDTASDKPSFSSDRIASSQARLRDEIHRAVAYCKQAPVPVQLFINDHWHLAIEADAYGVHLGQEDLAALPAFALDAIATAGLRLGLSTHGYYEMLLALRFRPSYIACGPVFATTTKSVAVPPQGVRRLAAYCRLLRDAVPPVPAVAIGGIGLANVTAVRATGAASAAVVGAVVNSVTEIDRNALKETVLALQVAFNG